jgi:flagellar basal-body rod modification protein FlgD
MSTMAVNPATATTGTASTTTGLPSGQSLNNMFLQLLVAQLQNQDPTAPVDPSQFVGQLAQFSELSEVTSIYTLLQHEAPATPSTGTSGGTAGTSSSANPGAAAAAATQAALSPLAAALPAAVSNAATTFPNFTAPSISALTNKIQGAF